MSDNGHSTTAEYQDETALRRASAFQQLADHGLSRWGGQIMDEFLIQLQGTSGRRIYREMADNCPIVGALLQAIEMAVRAVSWRVEPGSEDKADTDAAEFIQSCLDDMSFTWQDTLSDLLTMLPYGWSYAEVVFKRRGGDSRDPTRRSRFDDGRIGWRKFVAVAQETLDRWEFQEDGGIAGLWQQPPSQTAPVFLPIERCLLFRTTARRNNPEGRSVLRSAYTTWHYRKNVMEILGIGLERDLTGLPVIVAPEGVDIFAPTNTALLTTLKKIVRDVKVDEQMGVILPFGYDLKLLASPGSRQHNITEVLNYLDRRIALTALAQFLLLGLEKVGSFALSQSQSDLFTLSLSGWVSGIQQVFNLHAIPRLLRLNGLTIKTLPTLEHGQIGSPNLSEVAAYIKDLTGAAVLNPDEELENYVRSIANLPSLPASEKETPPPPTLKGQRIIQQRSGLLSPEQQMRELGYSDSLISRILQEKRQGRLADTNIGGALLAAFERGHLTGDEGEE